ncbi:MAG: translation initiation factor IF-1 [Candidatus Paceibacterota bacterium]|jgi:translation initiation factor IF-1|nr:translation initiation factor IF-1 [Candidatus Paceibacterota bacterium]MDD5621426.1 translation initiation factor IF-1 [Candidatus Paceibacterota bacterium]
MSEKKATYKSDGIITEALPSTTFKVRLNDGREVLAHLAGKLRMFKIKILPGDKVTVEMPTPNDERGRIIFRKR